MYNFRTIHRTTPSGRKDEKKEEKREREKNIGNSGHYVVPAMPKGSAHTSLRPIVVTG